MGAFSGLTAPCQLSPENPSDDELAIYRRWGSDFAIAPPTQSDSTKVNNDGTLC
jgi:hypothetical protein